MNKTLRALLWLEASNVLISVLFGGEALLLGDGFLKPFGVIFLLGNLVGGAILCALKAAEET